MSIFTGAGAAIITPFYPNGSFNYEEFDKLAENQIPAFGRAGGRT